MWIATYTWSMVVERAGGYVNPLWFGCAVCFDRYMYSPPYQLSDTYELTPRPR